jgi:crotonobetainyl-CoA:carnitine CoA-transferase CaiB-like acyl-CoA transferase
VQNWILTFADVGALDAQLDEAKIAFGEVRSLKQLSQMEWAEYWGAVQEVSDRNGRSYRLPGRPWRFSREQLKPLGEPAFQGEHNRPVLAERRNRRLCPLRRSPQRVAPESGHCE